MGDEEKDKGCLTEDDIKYFIRLGTEGKEAVNNNPYGSDSGMHGESMSQERQRLWGSTLYID